MSCIKDIAATTPASPDVRYTPEMFGRPVSSPDAEGKERVAEVIRRERRLSIDTALAMLFEPEVKAA